MVTPTTGTLTLQGKSGKNYSYSVYIADAVGTNIKFSSAGIATAASQSFLIAPEDCIIKDLSVTTGPTVITTILPFINDVSAGAVIALANAINTLAFRAIPNIGFAAGRKITLVEA